MLRFVVRRAWAQRVVLSAVVVLVAVATSLMGVCALLLEVTGSRAFHGQVLRLDPDAVDVTAYVVDVPASDLDATRRQARGVVEQVLGPLRPELVSTATSRLRRLDGPDRLAYLATTDALRSQVSLTSGRWPRDDTGTTAEALVPDAAFRNLGLHRGERVRLGSETGLGGSTRPASLVVVGTFRATSQAAWSSDPLSGAGFQPSYSDGSITAPTYGPFMVGRSAFLDTGSDVSSLRVDAHPDLRAAYAGSLGAAVTSLSSASDLLSTRVGGSAGVTRVASELPRTLEALHRQQTTTRAAVMVVLLLSTGLAVAALLLAGRLVADARTRERELLTALGQGRGQETGAALVEAGLLATLAAAVAVPAAAVTYSGLTFLPDLAAAGLSQPPTLSRGLVVTAVLGASLLTAVLTLSPLARWESSEVTARRRWAIRAGTDLVLLLLVAVSWWQLRSRAAGASGDDFVLALAPVLCLTAAAAVAVRWLLPLVDSAAVAAAARSRSLWPMAVHAAALRLRTGPALVLLSTAAAAATFGIALLTTWQHSQSDQADLRVGTGLMIALDSPPSTQDVLRVTTASTSSAAEGENQVVSPVTRRPVALGRFVGDDGLAPELVAVDARHAGALLRGRVGAGDTWTGVGNALTPAAPVRGLSLPAGRARMTLRGRGPASLAVSVTPRLVLQDSSGLRTTLEAAALPVDGRTHPLRWTSTPARGQRLVALDLVIADEGNPDPGDGAPADVSVELRVPDRERTAVGTWQARQLGQDSPVLAQSVSARRVGEAVTLTARARLNLSYLAYSDGEVLATAFAPPTVVPVAVSRELVDAVGTRIGGQLSATVGNSALLLRVVRTVPAVPSAPGQMAVLADSDTLSRALIGAGRLEPVVDAFWVAHPTARTVGALHALGLGAVTDRDEVAAELARGPLQVTVPLAYLTLVAAALLLLLAGAVLLVSSEPRSRSEEVARLRALGLRRRGAGRLLFTEHAVLLVPLVLIGVLVGAGAAVTLGSSLVRSEQGTAPVPPVVIDWPWAAESWVAGGLLLGVLLVAGVAAAVQVHRSDTAQLRVGD